MQLTRAIGRTSLLVLVTLAAMGAGCGRNQATTTSTTTSTTTNTATVTTPDEPSGDAAADQATVEDTLNQMKAAQSEGENAESSAGDSSDLENDTLPTSIPE